MQATKGLPIEHRVVYHSEGLVNENGVHSNNAEAMGIFIIWNEKTTSC